MMVMIMFFVIIIIIVVLLLVLLGFPALRLAWLSICRRLLQLWS